MSLRAIHTAPRPIRPSADAELVVRAQDGDIVARKTLFERYVPELTAMLRRTLGNRADVEDAVQQAFLDAFEKLSSLRDPHAFRPWLYRLAVRSARRQFWTQRVREVAFPSTTNEPLWEPADIAGAVAPDDRAALTFLGQRLATVPLPLRQAWVLRHLFDCTLPEAAEICGCSLATVKRRIAAADELLEGGAP